jgi:hypothetical protein
MSLGFGEVLGKEIGMRKIEDILIAQLWSANFSQSEK